MVTKAFKNGKIFLFRTQNTIISAAAVIAFTYGISAFLGLVRSRLLAHYFGASNELGIFYTADKIPSFIYSVLVIGTLSSVFIPVFTSILKRNEDNAWHTASSMISVSVLSFLFLASVVFLFAPQVIALLAVGQFSDAEVALGASLMRIMLGAQMLLVVSSFITSILQSFKYFLMPALAPVLYNIGMIIGILYLVPSFGIYGPALGVVVGSVLHLLIQLPLLRRIDFKYSLSFDLKDKGIRQIFSLMPPRIFGSIVTQISGIVNNSLVILISTSSVVIYKFASQLQTFPVLLFGASIASAALPTLSYESDEADKARFKKTFLTSFHQTMFLVMPASAFFLVLRLPVVRLVYGASNFPWEATIQTSYALAFFSLSMFAQSAVYLLNRAFFALKDTLTPVKVSLVTMFVSVGLSVLFIKHFGFGVWGVALSYSIGVLLDVIILLVFLGKKLGKFSYQELVSPFLKISYATVFMGISLYVPMKLLDINVLDTTRTVNLIILTVVATVVGMFSYLFFTKLFKVEEIELLYKLLKKLRFKTALTKHVSDRVDSTE